MLCLLHAHKIKHVASWLKPSALSTLLADFHKLRAWWFRKCESCWKLLCSFADLMRLIQHIKISAEFQDESLESKGVKEHAFATRSSVQRGTLRTRNRISRHQNSCFALLFVQHIKKNSFVSSAVESLFFLTMSTALHSVLNFYY